MGIAIRRPLRARAWLALVVYLAVAFASLQPHDDQPVRSGASPHCAVCVATHPVLTTTGPSVVSSPLTDVGLVSIVGCSAPASAAPTLLPGRSPPPALDHDQSLLT